MSDLDEMSDDKFRRAFEMAMHPLIQDEPPPELDDVITELCVQRLLWRTVAISLNEARKRFERSKPIRFERL